MLTKVHDTHMALVGHNELFNLSEKIPQEGRDYLGSVTIFWKQAHFVYLYFLIEIPCVGS